MLDSTLTLRPLANLRPILSTFQLRGLQTVLGILAWKEWVAEKRAARLAKAHSDEIDCQIEEDSRVFKRTCKILLMGLNDSDMSAIVRQMKVVHQIGYSREELLDFRLSIWSYLLETSRRIVQDLRNSGLKPTAHTNIANCERILNHPTDTNRPEFFFRPGFADAVRELWTDDIIVLLFNRPAYFPLIDNAAYFFPDIHRLTSKEYIPSTNDVLRAPLASHVGIVETRFPMGQLSIHVCHFIGQRGERKKWIHAFESITSIIFCTSLPDYNRQGKYGEGRDCLPLTSQMQNLLGESFVLFESVINSRWFLRTSIILFLTGMEEFKVKLSKVPLENYFPEYTGGTDANKGAKHILWRFMQANRARLNVYPHITTVSDTSYIRLIFVTVKETILQNALKESGIL
ncbi:G-protein alpha subunit [Lactarius indigo]|nr:G-protein alpha subunit [Lactarius indigo]